MDNFQTIELRWFYRGTIPAEMGKWFQALGTPLEPIDTRSDLYLQSRSPDIGLKLRQGNLEVKYRQQESGNLTIEGVSESRAERWSKCICGDRESGLTPTSIASKPGWIKVDKIRDRRLYRVDFEPEIVLTQIATPTAGIAAIELTQLQVATQNWWTLACEYFGSDLDLDRQFLLLVRALRSGIPDLQIGAPISCGYPQWLSIVE